MANVCTPRPDAQFNDWQNNLVTYIYTHPADLGFPAGVMGADIRGQGSVGVSPLKLRTAADSAPSRLAGTEDAKLRRREDRNR